MLLPIPFKPFTKTHNGGWAQQAATALLILSMGALGTSALAQGRAEFQHRGSVRISTSKPARDALALPRDVREVLAWVHRTGNNQRLPFVLIDKRNAQVHVFDANAALQASSPALLGLARGDASVPGIGERPIAKIASHERTTPAGRFESEPGRNLHGDDIVWIDYDAAISMHRVRSSNAAERRLQRLSSRTASDNRISFGCVNLPASFYDRFVSPVFGQQAGIVYVLPETQKASAFFGFQPSL